jgi:hypothetical protein
MSYLMYRWKSIPLTEVHPVPGSQHTWDRLFISPDLQGLAQPVVELDCIDVHKGLLKKVKPIALQLVWADQSW